MEEFVVSTVHGHNGVADAARGDVLHPAQRLDTVSLVGRQPHLDITLGWVLVPSEHGTIIVVARIEDPCEVLEDGNLRAILAALDRTDVGL